MSGSRLPDLSGLSSAATGVPTFVPKYDAIKSTLAAEFGPPASASEAEKDAWVAWKDARDGGASNAEVARLREQLEETVKMALEQRKMKPEDSWLPRKKP